MEQIRTYNGSLTAEQFLFYAIRIAAQFYIENIAILMIDDIHTDKIALCASITESLERLLSQNYISRNGEVYAFLTDEEQDIAVDIKNTAVDSVQVINSIAQTVFGEIYPAKKFKYRKYDFPYDQYIDETLHGSASYGIRLRIVTAASDYHGAVDQRFILDSQVNNEAIIVLYCKTNGRVPAGGCKLPHPFGSVRISD